MADLRRVAAAAMASRGMAAMLDILERADRGRTERVLVLTYHRVDDAGARPHLWPGLLSATPSDFVRHIEYLAGRMRPLSQAELLAALAAGTAPRRSVHVTIDDAYADVAEHAWPTLRRLGVPATLFVPTGVVGDGSTFWWDRVHHALQSTRFAAVPWRGRRLDLDGPIARAKAVAHVHSEVREAQHDVAMRLVDELVHDCDPPTARREILDWASLKALARDGLGVGAHSKSHPRLDRVSHATAVDEIRGSIDELRRKIDPDVPPILAYPGGDHADPAIPAAREAGVTAAFTTERGAINLPPSDPLRLRRANVGRRGSLGAIRVQAGSWMRLAGR